jgi:hypothetical protein
MGDLADFERVAFSWSICTLFVSRATVSKVMSAYTNHGKEDNISREEQWAKISIYRKR